MRKKEQTKNELVWQRYSRNNADNTVEWLEIIVIHTIT